MHVRKSAYKMADDVTAMRLSLLAMSVSRKRRRARTREHITDILEDSMRQYFF